MDPVYEDIDTTDAPDGFEDYEESDIKDPNEINNYEDFDVENTEENTEDYFVHIPSAIESRQCVTFTSNSEEAKKPKPLPRQKSMKDVKPQLPPRQDKNSTEHQEPKLPPRQPTAEGSGGPIPSPPKAKEYQEPKASSRPKWGSVKVFPPSLIPARPVKRTPSERHSQSDEEEKQEEYNNILY